MINNDWERFGDELRRTIQNAVDSRDFSRLSQTVSDTIGQARDKGSRGLKNGGRYRQNPVSGGWKRQRWPGLQGGGRVDADARGTYLRGPGARGHMRDGFGH